TWRVTFGSGPFARVYLRRSAEAAVVVPTPAEPPTFHPGYTRDLGPGVGTGRRCGLKSHGPKGRVGSNPTPGTHPPDSRWTRSAERARVPGTTRGFAVTEHARSGSEREPPQPPAPPPPPRWQRWLPAVGLLLTLGLLLWPMRSNAPKELSYS